MQQYNLSMAGVEQYRETNEANEKIRETPVTVGTQGPGKARGDDAEVGNYSAMMAKSQGCNFRVWPWARGV